MLLAYIDEIGEPGAFIAPDHPKFNTSPAFGYAGFVIPEQHARVFGARFTALKRQLFTTEIGEDDPALFERKGARIFHVATPETYPHQIRVFNDLVKMLRSMGGALFYYADEKPLGTPKQTQLDVEGREAAAMRETLNRLARHADRAGAENLLVMIDQINETTRIERLHHMYGHIFGRASEHPEMKLIVEPPMHVDSKLSANIQFADWIAACLTRAIDYQLIKASRYQWITDDALLGELYGGFTHESKLHLWNRQINDLHHSQIRYRKRVVHPEPDGHLLGHAWDTDKFRQVKAAAERAAERNR
ncbi:DUF3800 domain-containing protein [Tomitella cavernea]|uniref:DUF3800 domain-containing protein n=1 Tax=Tomitella cavernea TaxID=1387982 RepID=A0ABP9D373_9ACTN|nr:DUF3800 domain-containing protein [Tomitella cavernea]